MGRRRVNEVVPAKLERGRTRFEEWRETRESRRIPEPLWRQAVKLAREYGVHRTSRALRLNFDTLKKRVQPSVAAARSSGPAKASQPGAFVDVTPVTARVPLPPSEGSADLELPNGGRLRLSWRGTPPDLADLSRVLGGAT